MSNVFELLAGNTLVSDALTAIGRLLGAKSPVASSPPKTGAAESPRAKAGVGALDGTPGRRPPLSSPVKRDWAAELPLSPSKPPPPLPPRAAQPWDFAQLLPADKRRSVAAATGGLSFGGFLGGALLKSTDGALSGMAAGMRPKS